MSIVHQSASSGTARSATRFRVVSKSSEETKVSMARAKKARRFSARFSTVTSRNTKTTP